MVEISLNFILDLNLYQIESVPIEIESVSVPLMSLSINPA